MKSGHTPMSVAQPWLALEYSSFDPKSIKRQLEKETLIRIGYDELRGYLAGDVTAWIAVGLPT